MKKQGIFTQNNGVLLFRLESADAYININEIMLITPHFSKTDIYTIYLSTNSYNVSCSKDDMIKLLQILEETGKTIK